MLAVSATLIAQNVPARPDPTRFTPTVLIPPGELDEPMVIQVLPDERVLIIERKGALKAYDPATHATTVVAKIPVNTKYYSAAGVVTEAEEGLFGLAIDPKFSENRWSTLSTRTRRSPSMCWHDGICAMPTRPAA